jgi:hypothetical protein
VGVDVGAGVGMEVGAGVGVGVGEGVGMGQIPVHCAAPIESVGDMSAAPKFMPDTVSVEPPVVGPFTVPRDVKTGAAHSDKRSRHCMPHGAQRSYHHM